MKNLKIKIFKTKKNQKLLRILIKFQKCWPNSRISTKLNHFGPLGEPRIAHTSENGPKHKLTLLNFASLRWSGVLLASLASDLNSALQGSCACIFVAGTSTLEEQCSGWWRGQGELQPVLRFEEHLPIVDIIDHPGHPEQKANCSYLLVNQNYFSIVVNLQLLITVRGLVEQLDCFEWCIKWQPFDTLNLLYENYAIGSWSGRRHTSL